MAGERISEDEYTSGLIGTIRQNIRRPDGVSFELWDSAIDNAVAVNRDPKYQEFMCTVAHVEGEIPHKYRGHDGTTGGNLLRSVKSGIVREEKRMDSLYADDPTIVPKEYKHILTDWLTKLSFIEAVTASTFVIEKPLAEEDGSNVRVLPQAVDARRAIGGIRNNILGWVRNGNAERLKERYGVDIEGINQDELATYAQDLLLNPNKTGNSIFCVNPNTLQRINDDIADAQDDQKDNLQKIKKVLGGLTHAIYSEIDKRIDDEKLSELEQIMRDQINYIDGDQTKPRENTIIMINGHTGAGKGTTLGLLGAKAVETGTDGIAGRGDGYSQYELVMGPFDAARAAGEYIPSKVMKLLFLSEMLYQRQELDSQGRQHDPVYVSGFPRTAEQVETFKGIENIKSVALTITPETATVRTLTRVAMSLMDGKEPREDDLNDLGLAVDYAGNKNDIVVDNVRIVAEVYKANRNGSSEVDIDSLSQMIEDYPISRMVQMSARSRYFKYDKVLSTIEGILEDYDIRTTRISGDGKTPEQVAGEVKEAIEAPVAA